MSERVPIIQIGNILLASIQVDLSDETTVALQEDLSQKIVDGHARGVVIDISALEIVDSFIGRMLASIASISKILDAKTIVVGMRPAVAITLTELGLTLQGIETALNAKRAFELLGEGEESFSLSGSEPDTAEVAE